MLHCARALKKSIPLRKETLEFDTEYTKWDLPGGSNSMFKNLSPLAINIRAPLNKVLRLAKATGFQGVEININEVARLVAKTSLDYVRQLFVNIGLRPGGWSLPVAWHEIGKKAFWRRKTRYQRDLEMLSRLAQIGQQLGCVRALTWVWPYSDDKPYQENFDWHVARLQPIAEILKRHGCCLGLEFLGTKTLRVGHKHEFICTIDGILKLCDAIGMDNTGLLLDSWHWYTSHGTLEDLRRLSSEQVVYVHINDAPAGIHVDKQIDNIRCLPGETGIIDLVNFLRSLKEIGYNGPVTPEPFSEKLKSMSVLKAMQTTYETLDRVWRAAALQS